MPQRGRRNVDELLIMALVCGATLEKAAASAGVSKATAFRRSQEPDFRKKLRNAKTEMVTRTADMLTAAGGEAVKTLLRLQKDPTPHSTCLGAARAILELGVSLRASGEVLERLDAVERQLAAQAARNGTWPSSGPNRKVG
jgi:hypothetical protein